MIRSAAAPNVGGHIRIAADRESRSCRKVALVHGYRRGGILRGVGQMFTVAITGVCRAVQV